MRFKITWQTTPYGDGYKVSIPNYEGGEVVSLDEVQQIEAERDRLRADIDAAIKLICPACKARHKLFLDEGDWCHRRSTDNSIYSCAANTIRWRIQDRSKE